MNPQECVGIRVKVKDKRIKIPLQVRKIPLEKEILMAI